MTPLCAPFPWFGGKRRVAHVVWAAFGARINNYVEPFAGSLAVLLGRPGGAGKIETVNDLDRYVANFWRAVAADPDAVARHADWPVNEADLHARHQWLVEQAEFRERIHKEPDFFDAKIAGWWVWGISQWTGDRWCPPAGSPSRQLPSLGVDRGVHAIAAPPASGWFRALQGRLRRVRVACGDWTRVLSPSVLGLRNGQTARRPCAVFLDPPYAHARRDAAYSEDVVGLSALVRDWAVEHGDDPELRIALCGYAGEHAMPSDWTEFSWKGPPGYAAADNDNRENERIWFSPHCLALNSQGQLFTETETR